MAAAEGSELESLLQFLYMAPIGLVQTRTDGEILMVNPLCAQLLVPLAPDGELSNLFVVLEGVAPDVGHRVRAFQPMHGMVIDALHMQVDAGPARGTRPRMLSLSVLKLDADRLMGVVSDISAAVERDRQLRQSHAWIESLIRGVADYALMSLDASGYVRSWNAGVQRVTGFDAQATIGRPYALFYPDDAISPQHARDRLQEADDAGWSLDEGWRLRQDGSVFWGSCLIAPLHSLTAERAVEPSILLTEASAMAQLLAPLQAPPGDSFAAGSEAAARPTPDAHGYSLIIRDISDQREARGALRQAFCSDHLTGLSNRRAFFEAGQTEVRRCSGASRPLSLVLIDADHFKSVNDQFGHAAGDAVLRHLAGHFSTAFRRGSTGRIGGEEFAALLPGTALEEALALAERFCDSISSQVVDSDGAIVRYTVSAGVAAMDAEADGLDTLLKRADAALYRAKANGRNRAEPWGRQPGVTANPSD